ncbi:hypothetical protein STAIW_v1c07290 [Spiroplasma taiwanense CT-1]|uniref:Uncharacterized protein n=1 Tax=Spiroplasma taiwanense CT-1 TaxID=1276220 RepID=S5LXJ9_9MOLU|nr:hypothetical protein STAIW_v1c07290 [Spiroplasma taiwanense CT-1]
MNNINNQNQTIKKSKWHFLKTELSGWNIFEICLLFIS